MTNDPTSAPRTRPSWPKTIGILSIVFASIALTCTGIGGLFSFFAEPLLAAIVPDSPDGNPMPPNTVPPFDAVMIASIVIGLFANVLLLAAGIATARRSPAGRGRHLAYALVGLVSALFSIYSTFHANAHQNAQLEAWLADHGDTPLGLQMGSAQQREITRLTQGVGLVTAFVLSAAWPVFCVVWFGMVKRAPGAMGADLPEPNDLD